MSKTYLPPPPDASKAMLEIIHEHYPFMLKLQPSLWITLRFVLADEESGPALTKNGWPCEALVTNIPLKMRAAGAPDILIEVDAEAWHGLSGKERFALLHHELNHIEVVGVEEKSNDDGEVYYACKADPLGRPSTKLRKHDYECGGFTRVHEVYGEDSPEARQLIVAHSRLEQQVFTFAQAV